MTGHDDPEITLYEDVEFWTLQLQDSRLGNVKPEQAMSDARNYMELEALVKALDTLETIASCVHISEEYVFPAATFIPCLLALPFPYSFLSFFLTLFLTFYLSCYFFPPSIQL